MLVHTGTKRNVSVRACVRVCVRVCVCVTERWRERETCAHFEDCSFLLLFFVKGSTFSVFVVPPPKKSKKFHHSCFSLFVFRSASAFFFFRSHERIFFFFFRPLFFVFFFVSVICHLSVSLTKPDRKISLRKSEKVQTFSSGDSHKKHEREAL